MKDFSSHAKKIISIRSQAIEAESIETRKELINKLEAETRKEAEEVVLDTLESKFKTIFSVSLMIVFFVLNVFIVWIIHKAFLQDLLYLNEPDKYFEYKRLVDQKVLIALIAGVLAETALAFGLLARYVFNTSQE